MGAISWPPLPQNPTHEDVEADIAALQREIRRNRAMLAIVFGASIICGIVLLAACASQQPCQFDRWLVDPTCR